MNQLILLLALLSLGGCATSPDLKPPVCDGKHRRPANPYGSVLPSAPGDNTPPPANASAPVPAAAPTAKPPAISWLDPKSYKPCRGSA